MNLFCKWFGHKLPKGWSGGAPYLKVRTIVTDAIGQRHAFLDSRCSRCHKEFHVANLHLPENNDKGEYKSLATSLG